jgi:hypothetical protein
VLPPGLGGVLPKLPGAPTDPVVRAKEADLQVHVAVDDLAVGAPKPMYAVETRADSGQLPGAVITLNPYVAAARFVIADGDLDRNVEQSATQIARQTARYVAEAKTAAP